jgi:Xaa-Pro aminopeptidase
MIMTDELDTKLNRIQELLSAHKLEALLIRGVDNFAWATCGAASYINTADNQGVGALLITPTNRYLITNNIEAPRFQKRTLNNKVGNFLSHPGMRMMRRSQN